MVAEAEEFEVLPRGLFVRVGGLILIAVLLVGLMAWLLSGQGSEFFHHKALMRSYMSDGAGLLSGAPVRLNGIKVGRVTDVNVSHSLNPNRVVKVEMKIETQFLPSIPVDSIAALTADNVLGDHYINISAGRSAEYVQPENEIASLVTNGQFNPADLVASLKLALTQITAILNEIDRGNSPVAQFIKTEAFYDNARDQVTALQKAIKQVTDKKTVYGKMFFDEKSYNEIRQPILNVDRMLENMQKGEGVAGKWLNDSRPYDNLVAQTKSVGAQIAQMRTGLNDDKMYRVLVSDIASINASVDRMTTGTGAIAKLYQNAELYNSLNGSSAQARQFLGEFRQNPQKFLRIKVFGKAKPQPIPPKRP